MIIPIAAVSFDTEVRGPGAKQAAAFSQEYAIDRNSPGMVGVAIEFDADLGVVVLSLKGAKRRRRVLVPVSRVRSMDLIDPPDADTKKPETAKAVA